MSQLGKRVFVAAGVLAALVLATTGRAAESTSAAQFEQLKKLAGEWRGTAEHGEGDAVEATVTYRVVSAGSAVMETLFPGTPHEMITIYHLHGDQLLLTHYCAAGNQPRMRTAPPSDAHKLVFQYLDGTNLDPAKDLHMHEMTMELVSGDHLRAAWVTYQNGKPMGTARFDLKRKTP